MKTVEDPDELVTMMMEYYQAVAQGRDLDWEWHIHPRILYVLRKWSKFPIDSGPPDGGDQGLFFGMRWLCTNQVHDLELVSTREVSDSPFYYPDFAVEYGKSQKGI